MPPKESVAPCLHVTLSQPIDDHASHLAGEGVEYSFLKMLFIPHASHGCLQLPILTMLSVLFKSSQTPPSDCSFSHLNFANHGFLLGLWALFDLPEQLKSSGQ
jgi:hypothetical protein